MLKITIEIDPKSKEWLNRFPGEFRKALVRGVKDATLYAERQAKQNVSGKVLNVGTGRLRQSIQSDVTERGNEIIGSIGSNLIYSRIHELGGIIRAKTAPFLKFQVGGEWRQVKEVKMPARPYLAPAFTDNIEKIKDIITKRIDEAVTK